MARKPTSMFLLTLAALTALMTTTGCDLATGLGYGLGAGWDYLSGFYPDYGLYDPFNDIQNVIGYRQEVMDWSNDAWDAYIRQ